MGTLVPSNTLEVNHFVFSLTLSCYMTGSEGKSPLPSQMVKKTNFTPKKTLAFS